MNNGNNILFGSLGKLDYFTMLFSMSKRSAADYNPTSLEIMNKLAETYVDLGNLNSAKKFSEKIINLSKTRFGENNFYEWKALGTLSKIYRAEGNFSAALETDKKSLKIAEKVCGKKSLERLKSLDAIAGDHTAACNIEEAIKIREKTLAEYQKILECNDAATTQLRTNLAENYLYAKRYDDAIKLCDETLANQNVPKYIGEKLSIYPCVTDLVKIKAKAQKLSGDDMKDENYRRLFWLHAFENYRQLIFAYEIKRSVLQIWMNMTTQVNRTGLPE